MTNFSLLICRFPGNNQEHPRSAGYVIGLMHRVGQGSFPGLSRVEPYTVSDTPVTVSRNRAVRYALDHAFDYILMIDSDMHPDLHLRNDPWARPFFDTAWAFLMDRRRSEDDGEELPPATVAAPYCGPPPEEVVMVLEWKTRETDNPNSDFHLGLIPRESAAIRAGFQDVAALATGLILYDARVFKRLPLPWFDYEYTDLYRSEKATTEDVYQTRNASLLGMPQFVLWDAWAGHVKPKTVGRPTLLRPDHVAGAMREALGRLPSDRRVGFLDGDAGGTPSELPE